MYKALLRLSLPGQDPGGSEPLVMGDGTSPV